MAAVLAVGPGAVLSHRSAAALWNLRRTARARIDVTTPNWGHPRAGIDVHRVRALSDPDVTSVRGIPCTTVPRTLLDLAEVVPRRDLERAFEQAEVAGTFDLDALGRVIGDNPTRHGAFTLGLVLSGYAVGWGITRGELEERFLALCRRGGIRPAELNVTVGLPDGGVAVVDALWRRERLVVETDGRAAHGGPMAFERDRHRDAQLLLAGFRVVRFTWRQVTQDPRRVAATVRTLLREVGGAGTARPASSRPTRLFEALGGNSRVGRSGWFLLVERGEADRERRTETG